MNLPRIAGRECVPIRLLPFLTDWETLTPDVVAQLFANIHPLYRWSLSSFSLQASGTYMAVLPDSWVDISIDLDELATELNDRPHPEWRERAIENLPAGVFMWLDDLNSEVGPSAKAAKKKSGVWRRELNFTPLLSATQESKIFEGFGAAAAESHQHFGLSKVSEQINSKSTRVNNILASRVTPLSAVIEIARKRAIDPNDWINVWAALVVIAQDPDRPPPLLGYVEGEGVKYQTDKAENPVEWLSRESLRKRIARKF